MFLILLTLYFTLTFYNEKPRNKASEWTHPKRRVAVVVGPQAWPARAPSTKQSLIDQLGPTATLPPVLPSICSSTSWVLSTSWVVYFNTVAFVHYQCTRTREMMHAPWDYTVYLYKTAKAQNHTRAFSTISMATAWYLVVVLEGSAQ